MPDKTSDLFSSSQVQDKRVIPPGVIPRNRQAWVLGGIAVVMVTVIALSGTNPPRTKSSTEPVFTAVEPTASRIEEYRKRIEEQTRKLQLEQSQFAQYQDTVGTPSGDSASMPSLSNPRNVPEVYGETHLPGFPDGEDHGAQAEKAKREYQSLFASNLALSYRGEVTAVVPPSPTLSAADELARILSMNAAMSALTTASKIGPIPAAPSVQNPSSSDLANSLSKPDSVAMSGERRSVDEPLAKSPLNQGIADDSPGTYRVYEGTVLETALTNRLDGSFSGPVNCMVTANLYSHVGRRLLVPQGSRVFGEVHKVESFGQQRLAVFFHRLLMPDGYSVNLDQFQGLNQIGETGLRDQVNHHYLQIFGVSLAIGAIAGLGQANAGTGVDRSGLDNYEQGVTTSLSQSSLRILDRYLNVLPTVTIREGLRVKIFLSQDLLLPAYDRHKPGSF